MKRILVAVAALFILAGCGYLTPDGTGLMFKTANPDLTVGFRLLPAPEPVVAPDIAPEPLPLPPDGSGQAWTPNAQEQA